MKNIELSTQLEPGRAPAVSKSRWPNGHRFAFTVVDDTDRATIANVKPVYDLLAGLGMKTTKTVWMFPGESRAVQGGATCEQAEYVEWLLSLQAAGFEIALHNAAPCSSRREMTSLALAKFRKLFGAAPILFCQHCSNRENLYWGDARLSGWRRLVYNVATRGRHRDFSRGHAAGDPLFWGDLCQQQVAYVRNFVFDELNALAVCPEQPYHDPARPYVNFWFTSADGGCLPRFLKNFTLPRIQRLVEAGGLCIAYVHFAYGFVDSGGVHPEFRKRLEQVAALNGWFAPASEVLDYLRQGAEVRQRVIPHRRLRRLEAQWLLEKLFKGTT